jgi:urea transporter
MLLAAFGFGGPESAVPADNIVTAIDPIASDPRRIVEFSQGVFHSISQVFFKGDGVSALLILLGLAVSSLPAAAFALGGAIVAVVVAHLFGVESALITSGLQGFSPVLTAIALGTVFYQPSMLVIIYAALGTIFAVIVQSALGFALAPLGLPPLSAPFDLVAWIFFIQRKHLIAVYKANASEH